MSTLLIPTATNSPDYTIRTALDGRDYNLHFVFNQREGRWYLHLHDNDGTHIVGLKLIANRALLRYYHSNPAVPPGELFVVDMSPDGSPPGISDLGEGKRCQLTYTPVADILAT